MYILHTFHAFFLLGLKLQCYCAKFSNFVLPLRLKILYRLHYTVSSLCILDGFYAYFDLFTRIVPSNNATNIFLILKLCVCRVVIPLCGGNIDTTILGRCLERGLAVDGRLVRFIVQVSDRPGGIAELTKLIASIGVR